MAGRGMDEPCPDHWEELMNHIASRWRKAAGLAIGLTMLSVTAASAVDVTIWCWDTNFNGAAMREAAARYKAIDPNVNIIIDDSNDQNTVRTKLQTSLLAGNTKDLPDIVL